MGFGVPKTRNTRAGSHEAAGIFISRDLETPNASNERLQADRTCSTFPSGERRWTISMSSAGNRASRGLREDRALALLTSSETNVVPCNRSGLEIVPPIGSETERR